MNLIETENLARHFQLGGETVVALASVSLAIAKGEFVAVMGPSGSGKSTFMNLIGCLDRPTSGKYLLAGETVSAMNADALAGVRSRRIGFVFQQFNLMERADALANVELPMIYSGASGKTRRERATRALQRVGLGDRLRHRPTQLSGGQQQRVAIARALANDPAVLLADEPTGALDSRTSLDIMALFQQLNRDGATVIIVTHEADVAAFAARVVRFRDGRVIGDVAQTPRDAAAELDEHDRAQRSGSVAA